MTAILIASISFLVSMLTWVFTKNTQLAILIFVPVLLALAFVARPFGRWYHKRYPDVNHVAMDMATKRR